MRWADATTRDDPGPNPPHPRGRVGRGAAATATRTAQRTPRPAASAGPGDHGLAAAGQAPGPAVRRAWGTARRPEPDRDPRTDQGDRPVRPRTRQRLRLLRGAHHLGEIKRHFRDQTWDVRVPRRLQEIQLDITNATATVAQCLGRSPSVADLAAHLNRAQEEILKGLDSARAYSAVSLRSPVGNGEDSTELGDLFGAEDPELRMAELCASLGPALAGLPANSRSSSCGSSATLTQTQIAERSGCRRCTCPGCWPRPWPCCGTASSLTDHRDLDDFRNPQRRATATGQTGGNAAAPGVLASSRGCLLSRHAGLTGGAVARASDPLSGKRRAAQDRNDRRMWVTVSGCSSARKCPQSSATPANRDARSRQMPATS
jgi:Sigma-70 region 3